MATVRARRALDPAYVIRQNETKLRSYYRNRGAGWSAFRIGDAETYWRLFDEQGGVCAICQKVETATRNGRVRRLSVDHDHQTGEVRGLLCALCNAGIGHFRDRLDLLTRAMEYLAHPDAGRAREVAAMLGKGFKP